MCPCLLQQPKDICYRAGFCASKSVRMEKLMPAKSIPVKSIPAVKMFPATKLEKPAETKPAKVQKHIASVVVLCEFGSLAVRKLYRKLLC